jgi:hypothetical protein
MMRFPFVRKEIVVPKGRFLQVPAKFSTHIMSLRDSLGKLANNYYVN